LPIGEWHGVVWRASLIGKARGHDEIGLTEVIEAARVSGSVRGRIVVKIG